MKPSINIQLFLVNDLAIHLYSPKEAVKNDHLDIKNAILYVPGLPQITDKRFFQKIIDSENAFFYVYYYGSWLSGKKFTPENCRKSVTDALKIIGSGSAIKSFDGEKFSWNFDELSILGCSFAGNPVLSSGINDRSVKKIELYAPLIFVNKEERENFMTKEESGEFDSYNESFLYFMRHGYVNTLKGIDDHKWDEYFKGNDAESKIVIDENSPEIMIHHGLEDRTVTPKSTEYFQSIHPDKTEVEFIPEYGHDFTALYKHINGIE